MSGNYLWLECNVQDGMFTQEKIVESETAEGKQFSLFANNSLLKNPQHNGDNLLRVQVFNIYEQTCEILLPVEPFGASRMVSVQRNKVQS